MYVKQLSGVGYVSVKRTYPTPDSFDTLIPRSRTVGNVAYTVFVWSRLGAPVQLSTHYTTPDTTVEIGSTSATVE